MKEFQMSEKFIGLLIITLRLWNALTKYWQFKRTFYKSTGSKAWRWLVMYEFSKYH